MDRNLPRPQHYIREWRRYCGLTQAQLAEAVGIDRSLLNKIERGRRNHPRRVVEAIAARLECAPDDLIRRHPSHVSELETLYHSLSPEDQPRALGLLKLAFARSGSAVGGCTIQSAADGAGADDG